jgi:hypothetical protein
MSHSTVLDPTAVKQAALPLLKERLDAFGFSDADVVEEIDFDGVPILRMTAEVATKVPASDLIAVTADIHDAIRKKGDDRYIYLSTHRPTDDEPDEVEE